MKVIKMIKIALVLTTIFAFTSCQEEEITPRQTVGDSRPMPPNPEL